MEQLTSDIKEEPVFHTEQYIKAENDCDNAKQASTTALQVDNIKTEPTRSDATKSYIKEFDIRKLNMEETHNDAENWNSSCYTVVYRCSTCKRMRRAREHIRAHEPTCQRDIRMVKCSKCEYVTTILTNMKLHFSRKHDLAFKQHSLYCYHCDYTSSFKSNLAEHIKRNHWVNYETFKCASCPYETKLREYLIKHIQRQHSKDNGNFHCTQCNYKSKYNHHLVQHVQVKHQKADSVNCTMCSYQTKCKQYLQKHMKRVHSGPVSCPHCEHVAKCGDYLFEHIKKHHSEHWMKRKRITAQRKRYDKATQCSHCEFSTKYPGDLKAHIQTQHNANCTVYKCDRCKYTTKHKTNLHKHVRVNHVTQEFCASKSRSYICIHCEFKTNYKDQICTHFVGCRDKWLHCRVCKFKTACNGYLQYHKDIADHHQRARFACSFCPFTSCSYSALNSHKVNYHKDIVTEVPKSKYVCTHCGFKANHKLSLNNHFQCKKATKETIKCGDCNFLTRCSPFLKLHVQNNHIKNEIVIEEEFSYLDFIKSENIKKEACEDIKKIPCEDIKKEVCENIKKEVCDALMSEQSIVNNGFIEADFTLANIKTEPETDISINESDFNGTMNNIQFGDTSVKESSTNEMGVMKIENIEYGFY